MVTGSTSCRPQERFDPKIPLIVLARVEAAEARVRTHAHAGIVQCARWIETRSMAALMQSVQHMVHAVQVEHHLAGRSSRAKTVRHEHGEHAGIVVHDVMTYPVRSS